MEIDTFTIPEGCRRRVYRPRFKSWRNVGRGVNAKTVPARCAFCASKSLRAGMTCAFGPDDARLRTAAGHPRRAHHRTRRHRRGADSALAVAPQTRQGYRPAVYQPQSRRCTTALRRRSGDLCKPARRTRQCPSRAGPARASLQQGIAGFTTPTRSRVAGQPTRGY